MKINKANVKNVRIEWYSTVQKISSCCYHERIRQRF